MRSFTLSVVAVVTTAFTSSLVAQSESSMPESPSVDLRNRLGAESSPYLLQHAENPVHWFAWGPEAFAAAQALNRPIFLSIGYSTCYWCHVMERESFENEDVAAFLNEHFICIKVDREERPDVDDAYMTAIQLLQGSGGWPLNVFLEPTDGKPFFGGTYFPPETQGERIGFGTLLERISEVWRSNEAAIRADADRFAEAITQQMAAPRVAHAHALGPNAVRLAVMQLMQAYDRTHGGFGTGPTKFPTPVNLDLLIEAGWNREDVRTAVTHTLDRMASGGIYDHVGGGFHRYSVDREWGVPHFEKMLYDNAQLVSTYAAVHARQPDPAYAHVIRETLAYIEREMTGSDGLFHSAQDAEVNHREGDNYLWTAATMTDALTAAGLADDVDFALALYGVDDGPNFQDPHHQDEPPRNVLHLDGTLSALANDAGMAFDDFVARVDRIDAALLAVRDTRDQPLTDDKRITSWNAMMITAYADAARVLDDATYQATAERSMRALLDRLVLADGTLARTRRGDAAPEIRGFLEDSAATIRALLALDRLDADGPWLAHATRLTDAAREAFGDPSNGAYFDARDGQGDLFVRVRSTYDGATPSGTGVMINNLVALAQRTGESRYLTEAGRALRAEIETISHRPTACVTSMLALHRSGIGAADGAPAGHADGPVALRVEPATITLADGASATITVTLTTTGSFHVNAHEPGVASLIPLAIALDDGAGLELDIAWPEAEYLRGPEGETMRIYQGEIAIPVTITRRGAVTGSPTVLVTYQPCDHHRCLEPETTPLDLTITAAP